MTKGLDQMRDPSSRTLSHFATPVSMIFAGTYFRSTYPSRKTPPPVFQLVVSSIAGLGGRSRGPSLAAPRSRGSLAPLPHLTSPLSTEKSSPAPRQPKKLWLGLENKRLRWGSVISSD